MLRQLLTILGCALILALPGCALVTTGTGFEKGDLLRVEHAPARSVYDLASMEEEIRGSMCLRVWAKVREVRDERPVYAKVEVTTHQGWAFRPSFFMWPVNAVRTPLGLASCGFSALSIGAHYSAVGVAFVVGCASGILLGGPWVALTGQSGENILIWAYCGAAVPLAVIETVLLPLDAVHWLIHGTPLYPLTREMFSQRGTYMSPWQAALASSWRFAWDYQVYPPLPWWPGESKTRRVVPGEEIVGDWAPKAVGPPPTWVTSATFRLRRGNEVKDLEAFNGLATINLDEMSKDLRPGETLAFTIEADVPGGGTVSRLFTPPFAATR